MCRNCGFDGVAPSRFVHGKLVCPHCERLITMETPALRCSADAYAYLRPIVQKRKQESFWVFYLDSCNRIIGKREICRGSVSMCIVQPREVFGPALVRRASSIMLAHNHPSGDPTPSQEDFNLTKRLADAGKLLGITIMDHLVVCQNGYFSFRDSAPSWGSLS